MIKNAILSLLLVSLSVVGFSQTKVGHINTTELVQLMPELKVIELQYQEAQQKWQDNLAAREKAYREKVESYQLAAEDSTKSEGMLKLLEQEIQNMQQSYQTAQQTAQQELQQMQQTLYEPLTTKIKAAIAEVAKEKGYTHVLDSSEGQGLIYSDSTYDLLIAVKAKLQIP